MKKNHFCLFLIGCSLLAAVPSYSGVAEGYAALFQSRFEDAGAEFSNAVKDGNTEEDALVGLLMCDWARGEYPAAVKSLGQLITQYTASPFLPVYLSLLGQSELQGWLAQDRLQVLQTAYNNAKTEFARQQVATWISRMEAMLLSIETETASRNAGLLLDHWNVAGRFGRSGNADLFTPFGPENGIQEKYDGWQGEVSFQSPGKVNQQGWLELDGLFYPASGVVYALNLIECEAEGEGYLTIETPSDVRVWWDGKPVIEKTSMKLDTSREVSIKVPLRKGKISLLIKSVQQGNWWVRASLQTMGNGQPAWKTIPFNANEFSGLYFHPFETRADLIDRSAAVQSVYPYNLPQAGSGIDSVLQSIAVASWHANRSEMDRAKALIRGAIEKAPDCSLLHNLLGDYALKHASLRSGSRARFQQEAESAYSKALELDPHSKPALIGLQTYYIDRDQVDQALDITDDHLGTYPEMREQGYQGMIDYSYALLYSRKNFAVESIALMQKTANDFLPSFEVLRRLFDYYDQNRLTEKSVAVAAKALELFPANISYLNQASRLDAGAPNAPDAVAYLKMAFDLNPYNLQTGLSIGRALRGKGQMDEAKAWYKLMQERFPNHPQPLEEEAELSAMTQGGKPEEIYETLHARYPYMQKPVRALRDVYDTKTFAYQKYDVQLDDVDLNVADRWNGSRASSIYLLDLLTLQINRDGTFDQYIHQAIKILNQEGLQKWAEIVIPQGGSVEVISARTITPDGKEWALSHVQDLNNQQALSMYGIEIGSIVEYAYLQRGGNFEPGSNVYSGGYFFGTEDDPMLLSKMTVVRHKDVPFHIDFNDKDNLTYTEETDGDFIVQDWERWLADGIKPERFSPTLAKRVPSLQITTGEDWLPLIDRIQTTLYGFEEPSAKIDETVKELCGGSATKLDCAKKVYEWIQTNIEESSGGQTTADTVSLQAGSRYHKIRLARQMLGMVGVKTVLAAALDNDEGDGFRPLPFPAYPVTHLLIIPKQEGIDERIVLDFASRFAAFNRINPVLRKQVALVFDGAAPYFEPLEPMLWEHGLMYKDLHLKVRGDRSADIDGAYIYDNLYDQQIRQLLTNPEIKQRLADSQIANDLRGIRIGEYEIADVDDLSKPPRLVFTGQIPDVATPNGESRVKISPVLSKVEAANLIGEPTRESPIEFDSSPVHEPLQIRFDMSEYLERGAKITLPKDTFFLNEFGYYTLFYRWQGNDIVLKRSFLMPDQEIKPENYQRFVEFCRNVDQAERQEIQILLPQTTG